MEETWVQRTADSLLCKVGKLPFTYLGLLIGGNSSGLDLWEPIMDRMGKKLATWKSKMLSIGGRLTLLKASLTSLPVYFMSLFRMPKGIADKIGKLQRQFLWGGSPEKSALYLAPWKLIVLPKQFGGLGVGNIIHKKFSLLFKWVWRYFKELKALWRRVVCDKYKYPPTFTFHDLCSPRTGGPWRDICNSVLKIPDAKQFLSSRISARVGCGMQVLFWHDSWAGEVPLKITFPRFYRISSNQNSSIASMGFWEGFQWIWCLPWSRNLRARDLEDRESLREKIDGSLLSLDGEDSLIWKPHKTGLFSVKSMSLELDKMNLQPSHDIIKGIWRGLVPPRIEVFSWLALLGKINTRAKLLRIGLIPSNEAVCIFCDVPVEDHNHLLLLCPFAWGLWCWWINLWNFSWVAPATIREAFDQWKIKCSGKFFKKV